MTEIDVASLIGFFLAVGAVWCIGLGLTLTLVGWVVRSFWDIVREGF